MALILNGNVAKGSLIDFRLGTVVAVNIRLRLQPCELERIAEIIRPGKRDRSDVMACFPKITCFNNVLLQTRHSV